MIIFISFIDPPSELGVLSSPRTSSLRFFVQSSFALWPNGFNQISEILLRFSFLGSYFFKENTKICDVGLDESKSYCLCCFYCIVTRSAEEIMEAPEEFKY